jgi:hypothetical protein
MFALSLASLREILPPQQKSILFSSKIWAVINFQQQN